MIIIIISVVFLLIINNFNSHASKNNKLKLMVKEIVSYSDISSMAYYNEPPKVAIKALKHYIKLLNIYKNQPSQNTKIQSIVPSDSVKIELMLSYTRLFFLYSKLGNDLEAEKNISQALEVNMTRAKTRMGIITIVKKIDSIKKRNLKIKNKRAGVEVQ